MTSLLTLLGGEASVSPVEVAPSLSEKLFQHLFKINHRENASGDADELEFTYSDFLADEKSLTWDKVEQFILEDANFRSKKLPRQQENAGIEP